MATPKSEYFFALFLVTFLMIFAHPVYAVHGGTDKLVPKKLIRVGVFPLAPLNYFDEAGRATGLYPDLIRAILQEEQHWKTE